MIDNQELLFVVDEDNKPLDPLPRHVVHTGGIWHRATGIWVVSRTGKILCQKRSLNKDIRPGMWEAFFGGHLGPNETYIENAQKELGEELGISVSAEQLIPYKVFKSDKPKHKEFQHVFAFLLPNDQSDFTFEEEEIDQIEWKTFAELETILIADPDPKWVHKYWDKEVLEWLHTLATSKFIS
jgi:isopentenyl-diphosphate Delta-isomerase